MSATLRYRDAWVGLRTRYARAFLRGFSTSSSNYFRRRGSKEIGGDRLSTPPGSRVLFGSQGCDSQCFLTALGGTDHRRFSTESDASDTTKSGETSPVPNLLELLRGTMVDELGYNLVSDADFGKKTKYRRKKAKWKSGDKAVGSGLVDDNSEGGSLKNLLNSYDDDEALEDHDSDSDSEEMEVADDSGKKLSKKKRKLKLQIDNPKLMAYLTNKKNSHKVFDRASTRKQVVNMLIELGSSPEAYRLKEQHYIPDAVWIEGMRRFQLDFMVKPLSLLSGGKDELSDFIDRCAAGKLSRRVTSAFLKQNVIRYIASNEDLAVLNETYSNIVSTTDLRTIHQWFPLTRQMKRKIYYHVGPTNSGKTHAALERLRAAKSGIYCGPLRLLALEIYERLNVSGTYCSLLTGQEQRLVPDAEHVACTIEMCNVNKRYECAVIDEIQMIGDVQRGSSWTRALLGIAADEIHVCGSLEAIDIVRDMVASTEDELKVISYERRSPIFPDPQTLNGSYLNVRKGDCIVAFSRKEIYAIKRAIERLTKFKCCVIYGSLPPETRSQQARLFNDPENDYDILVASDAVGMGLNLNIKRIVFHSVKKFDGTEMVELDQQAVKQIAGRAGRYGSRYPEGFYTTLMREDLSFVIKKYEARPEKLEYAGFFPTVEQLVQFSELVPAKMGLSNLLDRFITISRLDNRYFFCKFDDMKQITQMLQAVPMDLPTRWTFAQAPLALRDNTLTRTLVEFAKLHAAGKEIRIAPYVTLPVVAPCHERHLQQLEGTYRMIDLYLWLSYRFSATFRDREAAIVLKGQAEQLIEEGLENVTTKMLSKLKVKPTLKMFQDVIGTYDDPKSDAQAGI